MDLEQRLRALLAPEDPGPAFTAGVMAKLAGARRGDAARRSRFILIGTLAAVAAAAALLMHRLVERPGAPAPDAAAVRVPAHPTPASAGPTSPAQVEPAAMPTAPHAPPPPVDSALDVPTPAFTVSVAPLEHRRENAASVAATEAFRTALIAAFADVPGLQLLPWPADAEAGGEQATYRITLVSHASQGVSENGTSFSIANGGEPHSLSASFPAATWLVSLHTVSTDGRPISMTATGLVGDTAGFPLCNARGTLGDMGPCSTPAEAAQHIARELRTAVFPFDASIQQDIRARLRDPALPLNQKLILLARVRSLGMQGRTVAFDEADIRDIVEQVSALDVRQRGAFWQLLQGVRHPALVEPLLSSLQHESDEALRLQALTTLAADFADEPRVRVALAVVANEDPRPLVRMAARRVVEGEASWREYVVATLKDTRLPAAERLEPLVYAAANLRPPAESQALAGLLDREAEVELMRIVRQAWDERSHDPVLTQEQVLHVQAIRDGLRVLSARRLPELEALCIEIVREPREPWSSALGVIALTSLSGNMDDPQVHNVLEQVAAGEANGMLARMARQLLQEHPPATVPAR